jgi:hypothetical protein
MKGRKVPPPQPARLARDPKRRTIEQLIAVGDAKNPAEAVAIQWATHNLGGDDWYADSSEPPETVENGRHSWVVTLDRIYHDIPLDDMPLVEVRGVNGGYQARQYTGPVWTFARPKGGAA